MFLLGQKLPHQKTIALLQKDLRGELSEEKWKRVKIFLKPLAIRRW
jgi:hypothetical protein